MLNNVKNMDTIEDKAYEYYRENGYLPEDLESLLSTVQARFCNEIWVELERKTLQELSEE